MTKGHITNGGYALIAALLLAFNLCITVNAEGANKDIAADIPGIDQGEEVFQEFVDNTTYIVDNDDFKLQYSKLTENEKWKKEFLDFQGDNFTEEKWNSMSNYDLFIYRELYYLPYSRIINMGYSTEDEFVEAATQIKIMRKTKGGEAFADAMEKAIRWQWRYYEQTGCLYNFFAEDGQKSVSLKQMEKDENGLTAADRQEIESLQNDIAKESDTKEVTSQTTYQTPDPSFNTTDTGTSTGMIVIIVLLGMLIIAAIVIVVLLTKRKNN